MRPGAMPEELIRCYERPDGKKVSLMFRRDIPQYRTLFLSGALEMYTNWRLFNKEPPNGNGWANERNVTALILRLLESENNQYDAWEREQEDLKRKKP